ncbi:hypothetical protein A2592_02835 [Candidatus Kaiserbacteria bacterium RIFOXYD1_FULL_42_15]|uniref:Apolipoprotein N-acyltransferase n=1 Tax=Candidatus Kaiserbacteria bacterium RIFOXYD1_FULL_42_15 TaxID=1798532 RepID=A0A1F6FU19_9BACT|nr:MAG: hypothetical protein A2592_02835 [Candidatus Kaiserbacteria bacterium RIFOXYD1_FULL_42_15]
MIETFNLKNKYPVSVCLAEAILAGLCLGIGFVIPILWPLGLGGIILCLDLIKRNAYFYKVFFLVLVVWFIKSAVALSFFLATYPITWTGLQNPLWQIIAIAFYWLTNSLWLALGGLFFVGLVLVTKNKRFYPSWLSVVSLPLFWLLGELAGAWFFSFFTSGPDSLLQTYFSIGMVGYLLANSSFGILMAGLAGVYGLTIIFVFLAVATIELFYKNKKSLFFILPTLLIIFYSNWNYFISKTVLNEKPITIFSINTKFDSSFLGKDGGQEEKHQTINKAVEKGLTYNPDYILLPEDSRYLNYNYSGIYSQVVMSHFQFTHPDTKTILIDSGRVDKEDGTAILRANIFDSRSGKLYLFDKQYLVPQGEFPPYFYSGALRLFGLGKAVDNLSHKISYRRGPLLQTADISDYLPGILFCFESIRPDGVRSLAKERKLPFVAHPISHAWFHSSKILWQQQDVMLRIQARWQGIPIVSAGNMMQGKLYLPNGQIDNGEIIESGDGWNITKFVF